MTVTPYNDDLPYWTRGWSSRGNSRTPYSPLIALTPMTGRLAARGAISAPANFFFNLTAGMPVRLGSTAWGTDRRPRR